VTDVVVDLLPAPLTQAVPRSEKPVRVLTVHAGFGPVAGGGAERNYRMATHMLAAGHDVRMLITDKWLEHQEPPPGYPFPSDRLVILPLVNRRYDVPLPLLRRIDRAVAGVDVVHFMGVVSPLVPLVAAAARRRRRPWVICTAGSLQFVSRSLHLKRGFMSLFGDWIMRGAARIVATTARERATLARYAPPERVVTIPNAIDALAPPHPEAVIRRRLDVGTAPYLLFMGGFHPVKGADLLVEAFSRVASGPMRDQLLVLAGPRDEGQLALRRQVDRLGLRERVRFPGFLQAGGEKEAAIAFASFVTIPSRQDAMTMVVLEAAQLGTPVLLTSACGFSEFEEHGGGLVVEPTADDLARGLEAMNVAPNRSPEAADCMRSIAERHCWQKVIGQYLQLFREVAESDAQAN
jgi:glycosyltransferase involved in cell wall biosynthesis